ncbi:hypothetical protein [Halocatena pleomorpha]|uniref:Uncharacterized protein n=1 Tax=Halocatena pleomorpha TaxID=1785090 RepID=A0A3P3RHE4_9EURY|nr:hypothetical protein [Halocatena pleomorpha]RRJ32967.1 hypothetical protein EIK79_03815 [Halocatena pleomorpha]
MSDVSSPQSVDFAYDYLPGAGRSVVVVSVEGVREWIMDRHPTVLLVAGALLFTLSTVLTVAFLEWISTPLANSGVNLPFWLAILGPSLTTAGLYPTLGVPIVSRRYDDPLYRWVVVLQAVYGPFVLLTVAFITEVFIVHLWQLFVFGEVKPSWAHVVFLFCAIPAAFVGIWGGLVCYWLWTARSE